MNKDIAEYNNSQIQSEKEICELLSRVIDSALPESESKIWHRHPVWFLEGNPIVGYNKLKAGIQLMFWSGQSFDEKELIANGSFKASTKLYTSAEDIIVEDLERWLEKSKEIQWDYKNIVKRKGKLVRLEL